jgi:glycine/D-amino acid oxidase-like deaminating enzyme
VNAEQTADASTIASTVQQMAVSFGIASASLTAALFIPDHTRADPSQMIHGIHLALRMLGAWTILSTIVFGGLKAGDGAAVSAHKAELPAG